jgi:serine/threonine protein kinase
MKDAIDALEYLHKDEMIIHCDIKPGNWLVTGEGPDTTVGIIKLADFGMAVPFNEREIVGGRYVIFIYIYIYNPCVAIFDIVGIVGIVVFEIISHTHCYLVVLYKKSGLYVTRTFISMAGYDGQNRLSGRYIFHGCCFI